MSTNIEALFKTLPEYVVLEIKGKKITYEGFVVEWDVDEKVYILSYHHTKTGAEFIFCQDKTLMGLITGFHYYLKHEGEPRRLKMKFIVSGKALSLDKYIEQFIDPLFVYEAPKKKKVKLEDVNENKIHLDEI